MQPERYVVLVIDDDDVDREHVRRLCGEEMVVLEASSAAAGRRALAEHAPDCVLIDYRLPDADGLDLLNDIARDHPRTAPMFLTGEGDEGVAVRAMKSGALDYLVKDALTPEVLHVAVRSAVARKRMEVAVREKDHMFRAFCEEVHGIVWIRNAETFTLEYVNAHAEEIFGRPAAELLARGDAWAESIHPDDRARLLSDVEARVRGEGWDEELRVVRPDGSIRWIRDRSFPLHDASGNVSLFAGIAVDVTDDKQAEEDRRRIDERLEWAIHGSSDGLWFWNVETDEIYWSPRLYELLGLDPSAFTPTRNAWFDLHPPEDAAAVRAAFRALVRDREPFDIESRVKVRDGSYRWFRARAKASWNSEGKAVHVAGSLMDVTERHELEAQLRHALKMEAVGRLAGGVAHDFNNLLMVINGHADLALVELDQEHPLRMDLEQIRQAGSRAADLTRQLLAFSRKDLTRPQVLNLNRSIEQSMKMLSRMISEDVELRAELAPELANVYIDPSHVDQILVNLVVNSRDAMPEGGVLTVRTENLVREPSLASGGGEPGTWVALTVQDTGCGMDRETLDHALEPFFTTKGRHQGTGLGLATVYGVVKQAGGDIDIWSEVGEGTAVHVYLPRCADATPTRDGADAGRSAAGTETVLLVEDTDVVRDLVRRVLDDHGYRVLEAEGGEQALEIARGFDGRIDMLLTDVVMPGIKGPEVAARLQETRPDVRVLYMSGYVEDRITETSVLGGSKEFLQKPATPASILSRVRQVLDAVEAPDAPDGAGGGARGGRAIAPGGERKG